MSGDRDTQASAGTRLLRWADKNCARDVVESIVRPIIADLQFEEATGFRSRVATHFVRLRADLALLRALALHAVTRETARKDQLPESSIKVFAIVVGVLAVLVSVMDLMGFGLQDPQPSLLLAIGMALIALGVCRPVPRWLPKVVAFCGFIITAGTLYVFRDSDYQGTGSLILMPVFGAYAETSLPVSSIIILTGPVIVAGGLMAQLRGRPDHGLLVAIGILFTVLAIGQRTAGWHVPIVKVAWPLGAVSVGLALVLLLIGNADMAWDALIAGSLLSLLSGFRSSNPTGALSILPQRDQRIE
jgi:hypothetical protein